MELIQTLTVGMLRNECYILTAPGKDVSVLIDPGAEAERIKQALQGRKVGAILLTHGHFDHIGAVRELMDEDTRLFIHPEDAPMLTDSQLNASEALTGTKITVPEATDFVHEGDEVYVCGIQLWVLHTPGHTPGSVCYRLGQELFTGDTMFKHGWGRTDLPGGSPEQIMQSLRRIVELMREGVRIHPGHDDD